MNKEPSDHTPPDPDRWEAIARYLAGESTPTEANEIRKWLAADPRRDELIAALGESLNKLEAAPAADIDVEAALRQVKARMDPAPLQLRPRPTTTGAQRGALEASVPRFNRRWSRTLTRLAATIVVVLGVSLIWRASQENRAGTAGSGGRVYSTATGQTDSLQLADGTMVVLAPASKLTLARGYGSRARVVELNGEAFFDVKHDANRPFSVRAGAATIRDIGTAFVVRNTEGQTVRVAVTSGSVVLHASTKQASQGVVLQAGDLGLLDRSGQAVAQRGRVTDDDIAFTSGRLVFADATLDEVAAQLDRWYGIKLKIIDRELASRHVTATFDGDSARQVLNVIELALGARIELQGDTAIVRSSR
jgi:transmembrane sensor